MKNENQSRITVKKLANKDFIITIKIEIRHISSRMGRVYRG